MVSDTRVQRAEFGRALETALADKSRAWFASELARVEGTADTITTTTVGNWVNGQNEPRPPARVFAIEKVLELPGGFLSRHLGYMPPGGEAVPSVLVALEQATELTDDDRRILSELYARLVVKRRRR